MPNEILPSGAAWSLFDCKFSAKCLPCRGNIHRVTGAEQYDGIQRQRCGQIIPLVRCSIQDFR